MSMVKKHSGLCVFLLLLAVVIFCAWDLDYSAFVNFSGANFLSTVKQLFHPDWGYFYDGSGEDVFSLILLTIAIAFAGTAIGTVLAIPFTLLASRNLWSKHSVIPRIGKTVLDILRAFPELIYAIIFVKVVGPGPFAGMLAIGVHQIGMLGKLFAEEMEKMNEEPVEACKSVGANGVQTIFYARIPQVLPIYSSLILNHFEIGVRSASTLGLVGAGGIGAPLIFAIQARNWDKVSIILLSVIVTVYVLDIVTGIIRKKLR